MIARSRSGILSCAGLLVSFSIGGCGDAAPLDSGRTGAIDVDDLPTLVLVEEARIGSLHDSEAGLSRVGGLLVTEDERLFVLEAQEQHVRVYTPDGHLERRIGRRGEGPGEFRGPLNFGLLADTLWVADLGLERFTLFTLDGDLIATLRAEPVPVDVGIEGLRGAAQPWKLRGDGLVGTTMTMRSTPGLEADSVSQPELLLDRQGNVVDTLRIHTSAWPPTRVASVDGTTIPLPRILPDDPLHATVSSDRIVLERPVASSPEEGVFTLTRTAHGGDTVSRNRFGYRPVPVAEEWREERIRASVGSAVARPTQPDPAAVERTVREALEFPPYHPPVNALQAGADGTLWLQRADPGEDRACWVVVRPDGTARGTAFLPGNARIGWNAGDLLWTIEPDEFNVPWLVRYRVHDP
jgi:hypothetical protein